MKVLFLCFLLIFSNKTLAFDADSIKKDIEKGVENYVKDKIEEKKKKSKIYQVIVKILAIIKKILVMIKTFIINILKLIFGPFVNDRKSAIFLYR